MKEYLTLGNILAGAALIVALGVAIFGGTSEVIRDISLAGASSFDTVETTNLAVGSGCDNESSSCIGTSVTKLLTGTCALISGNTDHTASTTEPYDCAVTNAASGDIVIAQLATTTAWSTTMIGGFQVIGAKASSTAGYITIELFNASGRDRNATVAGYGSSTTYILFDL